MHDKEYCANESDYYYISDEVKDGVNSKVLRQVTPKSTKTAPNNPVYRVLNLRTDNNSSNSRQQEPKTAGINLDGSLLADNYQELYNPHVLTLSDARGIFGLQNDQKCKTDSISALGKGNILPSYLHKNKTN